MILKWRISMEIRDLCKRAFEVKHEVAKLTTNEKN